MGWFSHNTRSSSPPPKPTKLKPEILLQIPNARVHLAGGPEAAIELSRGDFSLLHLTEDSVPLATVIKVGDLSWPLTKDEPVVRVEKLRYLFTVPDEEAGFLNYGVSLAAASENQLASLDQFLKQNSCFSATHSASSAKTDDLCWKDYAPNIEDYNGVLAKAIVLGTGEIVKGIFKLSNEYSNQVGDFHLFRSLDRYVYCFKKNTEHKFQIFIGSEGSQIDQTSRWREEEWSLCGWKQQAQGNQQCS